MFPLIVEKIKIGLRKKMSLKVFLFFKEKVLYLQL
jgi:hypothetical protein